MTQRKTQVTPFFESLQKGLGLFSPTGIFLNILLVFNHVKCLETYMISYL
jgi:hypothetical protein